MYLCILLGHSIFPKSTSMRLVVVTSYLTAVIVVASYSAALITHLTLREVELPFNDYKEFLADSTYQLGMMRQSAQMDYFKVRETYLKPIFSYQEILSLF